MSMTFPWAPNCCTRGPYSFSGSAIMMSSSVKRNTLTISRLAEKDLPLPGVPRNRPFGFFKFLRFAIIRLLLKAFRP